MPTSAPAAAVLRWRWRCTCSAQICAVDISPDALALARLNAERHGVGTRIRLLQGDLLAPLEAPADMIVSNPPYTVLSAIDEGVRRHEPHCALDGGPDGLALYRQAVARGAGPAAARRRSARDRRNTGGSRSQAGA